MNFQLLGGFNPQTLRNKICEASWVDLEGIKSPALKESIGRKCFSPPFTSLAKNMSESIYFDMSRAPVGCQHHCLTFKT
jgi:hypothetical protein